MFFGKGKNKGKGEGRGLLNGAVNNSNHKKWTNQMTEYIYIYMIKKA
jgi:hypothetical protein